MGYKVTEFWAKACARPRLRICQPKRSQRTHIPLGNVAEGRILSLWLVLQHGEQESVDNREDSERTDWMDEQASFWGEKNFPRLTEFMSKSKCIF